MDRTYYHSNNMLWDEDILNNYVSDTFQTFADAVIPRSPGLAELYGRIQYYGASDLYTAEYLIMSLDSLSVPLAVPAAELLNKTADRYGQEDILPVILSLNRLAMMGYYSEWPGYGNTRLESPNQRTLEYYPVSWEQIGYPGPSLGYRAARSYSYT